MKISRYFFCFPQGGFNDICQIIWNCLEYCRKFNRILIIDTRYIITFKDDFRNFIIINDPLVYKDDIDELFCAIKNGTFFPIFVDDITKISNIKGLVSKFSWKKLSFIYYDNKVNMTFSLKNDYEEQFLFFSTVQGGSNIVKLLKISNIESSLKEKIRNRYLSLPENFISIHIRNTDYTSNFKKFFENHLNDFKNKNIFLATDDYKVVNFFKENIFKEKLFHFSNIPSIIVRKGRGFHHDNILIPSNIMIEDCISDFLLCCLGSKYYYSCKESGFSKNIEMIRIENNLEIIKKIIS